MGIVRVDGTSAIELQAIDPDATGNVAGKHEAKEQLRAARERIIAAQERLYAEDTRSLLVVLQAIDTGGKDGTIKDVFKGVNPQGCRVWSFKVPSQEERDHDPLWRYHLHTPVRGMVGVFNRSHYEEVLVVRVRKLVDERVWRARYAEINDFERLLSSNGTRIVKFYLHISRDEQKSRLQARLDDPSKRWKFRQEDLDNRPLWDAYQAAFQEAINRCATPESPWFVVPANRKWYRNVAVAETIADTLEDMDPEYPPEEPGIETVVIPD